MPAFVNFLPVRRAPSRPRRAVRLGNVLPITAKKRSKSARRVPPSEFAETTEAPSLREFVIDQPDVGAEPQKETLPADDYELPDASKRKTVVESTEGVDDISADFTEKATDLETPVESEVDSGTEEGSKNDIVNAPEEEFDQAIPEATLPNVEKEDQLDPDNVPETEETALPENEQVVAETVPVEAAAEEAVADDSESKTVSDDLAPFAESDPAAVKAEPLDEEAGSRETKEVAEYSSFVPNEIKGDDAVELPDVPPNTRATQNEAAAPPTEPTFPLEAEPITSVPDGKKGAGVRLSAEAISKAAERKASEDAAADEEAKSASAAREEIFKRAQTLVGLAGEKSGIYALGTRARVQFEAQVDQLLEKDEKTGDDEAVEKLKRTAAGAYRSLTASLGEQWSAKAVPLIREKLPDEVGAPSERALTSAVAGLVAALFLLPVLFGGGGSSKPAVDPQAEQLQRKLEETRAERTAERLMEKRARTEQKVFPDDVPPPIKPTTPPPIVTPPVDKVAEVTEVPKAKVAEPSRVASVAPQGEVSSSAVLDLVRTELGVNAKVIRGASFDSLAPVPTVALEATMDFSKLSLDEQRGIALSALKATKNVGYETVTIVEMGSGLELARAGMGVVLADEVPALKAELTATRGKAENLAMDNADKAAKVEALSARLIEERELNAMRAMDAEASAVRAAAEKASLAAELAEAQAEVAAVPDRSVLEERTTEAERRAEELAVTVETLSRQVTVARDDEKSAMSVAEAARVEAGNVRAQAERRIMESEAAKDAVRQEAEASEKKLRAALDQQLAKAQEDAEARIGEADKRTSEAKAEIERVRKELAAASAAERAELERTMTEERKALERRLTEADAASRAADASAAKREEALRAEGDKQAAAMAKERDEAVGEAERTERAKRAAVEKELASARKDGEAALKAQEKDLLARLDDVKRQYQGRLDEAAKASDARIKEVREELRAAVDAANVRTRDAEKAAKEARDAAARDVRGVAKERDDARKALEKLRAKSGATSPEANDAAGDTSKS